MSQPTLVTPIYHEAGSSWSSPTFSYDHFLTTSDSYVYRLNQAPGNSDYYIGYRWTDKTWYDYIDVGGAFTKQHYFGNSASDTSATARVSGVNPTTIYLLEIVDAYFSCNAIITNVYYEEPATGTEGSGYQLSYFNIENEFRAFIPASNPTTSYSSPNSPRALFYRIKHQDVTILDDYGMPTTSEEVYHTYGTDTTEAWRPPVGGTYALERVLTNPLEVEMLAVNMVTQAQLDAWNLANAPPDDDPPENDPPPTPVFVPRSARRGNLNFW